MSGTNITRSFSYAMLAKDVACAKLTSSSAKRRQAEERICKRMGRMRGLPQKIGQMLSFRQSQSFDSPFSELQESSEPMPVDEVLQILAAEWGELVDVSKIEIDSIGRAASIGQVHRANLPSIGDVAIKVQFPEIRRSIASDVDAIGWLGMPFGNLGKGFDLEGYKNEIESNLKGELDYRVERENQQSFSELWSSSDAIVVPKVIANLSTDRVLVSRWEDGEHANELERNWSSGQRQNISQQLLDFFLTGVFQHGLMQADWHPGNLRFRRTGDHVQLVVYDYGCVCRLDRTEKLALARLIHGTINGDNDPLPIFQKLGFKQELLEPIASKLPAVCCALFEPFCSVVPTSTTGWNLGERIAAILGDDRWNLRMAGPPRLIYLMRAFQGLFYYLNRWGQEIHWQQSLVQALKPMRNAIDSLELTASAANASSKGTATRLRIRIVENGQTKVQISQPVNAIERLDELIDAGLRENIVAKGIDLNEIVKQARRNAYAPSKLLEIENGDRVVTVSLE